MGTIKVIDLLNKIANGEEVPKKIKFDNKEYENEPCYMLYEATGERSELHFKKFLNDNVEILEEDKKIPEKLEKNHIIGGVVDNQTYYEEKYNIEDIGETVNKIIDYLKSRGE